MLTIGAVTIQSVIENPDPTHNTAAEFFPGYPAIADLPRPPWLSDEFLDSASGIVRTRLQTLVVRTPDRTIVIDTGIGSGKLRPGAPPASNLPDILGMALSAAGVTRDEVDVVVNTHLHLDHVGGNTLPDGGGFVPAFPRAQYVFAALEERFWSPDGAVTPVTAALNQGVYADSVAPLIAAGVAREIDETTRIDDVVTVEPVPGHTPGSLIVRIASDHDEAVLVGDAIHHPLQLIHPELSPLVDEDPVTAAVARRRLLDEIADRGSILIPAHFRGTGALRIERDGDGYRPRVWMPLLEPPATTSAPA